MEYYIPLSEIVGIGKGCSWYNRQCVDVVSEKEAAYHSWIRGRASSDLNLKNFKAAFNAATKACKKAYVRADAKCACAWGRNW